MTGRRIFKHLIALAFAAAIIVPAAARDWDRLEGCRLVPTGYADGDSFHALHDGKDFIFRLYFVDTPETDRQVPKRITEQAEAFGVSESEVMRAGQEAATFTERALRPVPFTVLTQWEDARGASRQPRFYAHVLYPRDGQESNLARDLVEAGFARAYGMPGVPPEWPPASQVQRELQLLQDRARRAKVGVYGSNTATAGPTPWRIDRLNSSPDPEAPEPSTSPSTGGLVSINSATAAELDTLPGIGPAYAERIIAARPFDSVDDLLRVRGIGPANFERIAPLATP